VKSAGVFTPETILIAGESESLLQNIKNVLGEGGYSTRVATSGAEAMALIRENPRTLLILDNQLPDMDARQLIDILAELGYIFPFIIYSESSCPTTDQSYSDGS
jgi:CheY-like chemotaxis protein